MAAAPGRGNKQKSYAASNPRARASVIAAAGALHFAMSVKVVGPEQMIYIALVTALLVWRLFRQRFNQWRRGPAGRPHLGRA